MIIFIKSSIDKLALSVWPLFLKVKELLSASDLPTITTLEIPINSQSLSLFPSLAFLSSKITSMPLALNFSYRSVEHDLTGSFLWPSISIITILNGLIDTGHFIPFSSWLYSNDLYEKLTAKGIEVILDDRNAKLGNKLNDWELISHKDH